MNPWMLIQSPKSLRRRLILQIGLMVVGLAMLGATAVVGINGLHQDFGSAVHGYQQLREVYEIGLNVAAARSAMQSDGPDSGAARSAMQAALLKLQTNGEIFDADLERDLRGGAVDAAMARLARMSSEIRVGIMARQAAADHRRQTTLAIVVGIGLIVVIGGIVIGVRQYRGVMRPLRRLSEAARAMAEGNFPHEIDPATRDREFTQLAQDFNYMAGELESLYRELERKVAAKSKQLVRSERLASVGYLAAGVAHEINNPLSIITGYGERALGQLDRDPDSAIAADRARQAIAVMCEEAYRCKQITDRLLSLARPGSESRSPVSMRAIADEVIGGISGLPEYRDRKIVIESDARDDLKVLAKDGEMKQVILNLLINAAQATDASSPSPGTPGEGRGEGSSSDNERHSTSSQNPHPHPLPEYREREQDQARASSRGRGLIRVTISRQKDEIELAVADNGRGMDAQTLDRVFEPFFTHKRGVGDRPGTGLGLSITHAIIAEHGGTISAESDGLGRGSRFIVRLPALKTDEQGARHVNR